MQESCFLQCLPSDVSEQRAQVKMCLNIKTVNLKLHSSKRSAVTKLDDISGSVQIIF